LVAAVERPDRDHLHGHAGNQGRDQPEPQAHHEAVGQADEGRGEIGAEHVERAVRQVDQIHDAEDERQTRREQEQQHAELDAVEALFNEIKHPPSRNDAKVVPIPQPDQATACRAKQDGRSAPASAVSQP
jgi:hypothetical protein